MSTYVGAGTVATGSDTTVAMPAGIVEDDMLVLFVASVFGYDVDDDPGIADWGRVGFRFGTVETYAYIKFAGASEPDVFLLAGDNRVMRIHAWRDVPLFDTTTAPGDSMDFSSTIVEVAGFHDTPSTAGASTETIEVAALTAIHPAMVDLPFIAAWTSNTFITIDGYSSTTEISSDVRNFLVGGLFFYQVTLNVTWKDVSGALGDESAVYTTFGPGLHDQSALSFWFVNPVTGMRILHRYH